VPTSPGGGFNAPWLTKNKNPRGQAWAGGSFKTAVRITVEIPNSDPKLKHWPELAAEKNVSDSWFLALDKAGGGGSDDWYIYMGSIPVSRIKEVEVNGKTVKVGKAVGFHGWKMSPESMRLPGPQFTDKKPIPAEDIEEAVEYLDEVKPGVLVGYSRGGAITMLALRKHRGAKPKVIYVAPAWLRGWAHAQPPHTQGVILHGDKDKHVPLEHSCELAKDTGMPLRVVEDRNHITILKDKLNPNAGKPVPRSMLDDCVNKLPDWGTSGVGTPEQVKQQQEFADRLGMAVKVAARYLNGGSRR